LFGIAEVLFIPKTVIKRDIINAKITQLLPSKRTGRPVPDRSRAARS